MISVAAAVLIADLNMVALPEGILVAMTACTAYNLINNMN